jgi:hypothetical protein
METHDILREQSKKLRHIEGQLCCINASVTAEAGMNGSKVISGTSPVTGSFQYFVVNTSAVVTAILDQDGNSLMTTLGLSGVTLAPTMKISVSKGTTISSITLSSGSLIAYNA